MARKQDTGPIPRDHQPAPRPRTAAAGAPGARSQTGVTRAAAASPLRATRSSSHAPPVSHDPGRPARNRKVVSGLLAAVVGVGLVFGVIAIASGGGDEPATERRPNVQVPPANSEAPSTTGGVSRADTTIAVLNGTTISGLARTVADDLRSGGFKVPEDLVDNAVEQNRSATVVSYAEGQRAAARAVAGTIKVGNDAIAPLDQSTRVLAKGRAQVVVIVGADQNQTQAQP